MMRNLRLLSLAVVAGLVVLTLVIVVPRAVSGEDKEVRDAIEKIADLFDKKDLDTAKKQGEALGKAQAPKDDPLEPVMGLLDTREKGGFGLGPKAGTIKPDGIEDKLKDLATGKKLTDAEYKSQAEAIKRMAVRTAGVAETALNLPPNKMKAAQWKGFADEMKKASLDLADAKTPDDVKTKASALNNTCANCHKIFKSN